MLMSLRSSGVVRVPLGVAGGEQDLVDGGGDGEVGVGIDGAALMLVPGVFPMPPPGSADGLPLA
ncbi:hypothetical protein [Kitasatospora sp. NPDC054795]